MTKGMLRHTTMIMATALMIAGCKSAHMPKATGSLPDSGTSTPRNYFLALLGEISYDSISSVYRIDTLQVQKHAGTLKPEADATISGHQSGVADAQTLCYRLTDAKNAVIATRTLSNPLVSDVESPAAFGNALERRTVVQRRAAFYWRIPLADGAEQLLICHADSTIVSVSIP